MSKIKVIGLILCLMSIFLGISLAYQSTDITSEYKDDSERFNAINNDTNWKEMFEKLSQFSPKVEIKQDENNDVDTPDVIDPNDINQVKLIGLIPDNDNLAIVLLPAISEESSKIEYKTLNVAVGTPILDGWILEQVESTSATWKYNGTNIFHTHHLFESDNSQNKKP